MGYKADWKFVNVQVHPTLDNIINGVMQRSGLSRSEQLREALMKYYNVTDLLNTDAEKAVTSFINAKQ